MQMCMGLYIAVELVLKITRPTGILNNSSAPLQFNVKLQEQKYFHIQVSSMHGAQASELIYCKKKWKRLR